MAQEWGWNVRQPIVQAFNLKDNAMMLLVTSEWPCTISRTACWKKFVLKKYIYTITCFHLTFSVHFHLRAISLLSDFFIPTRTITLTSAISRSDHKPNFSLYGRFSLTRWGVILNKGLLIAGLLLWQALIPSRTESSNLNTQGLLVPRHTFGMTYDRQPQCLLTGKDTSLKTRQRFWVGGGVREQITSCTHAFYRHIHV